MSGFLQLRLNVIPGGGLYGLCEKLKDPPGADALVVIFCVPDTFMPEGQD